MVPGGSRGVGAGAAAAQCESSGASGRVRLGSARLMETGHSLTGMTKSACGTELSYRRVSPVGGLGPQTVIPSKADTRPRIRDDGIVCWLADCANGDKRSENLPSTRRLRRRSRLAPSHLARLALFSPGGCLQNKRGGSLSTPAPQKDAVTGWSGGDGNFFAARSGTDETETGDQHCPAGGFGHGARSGDYFNASRARKVTISTNRR